MSLSSRLGNRFKIELFGRIVAVSSAAILTIILTRSLGANSYGLFSLALSVLGIAQIFSRFGIAKSAARYINEYRETDQPQISNILRYSFYYVVVFTFVVSLSILLSYNHLAVLIGESELAPLLLVGVLFIISTSFKNFSRIVLQGFEAIRISAIVHATDRGLRLVMAVTFVSIGYGAFGAILGYIVAFSVAAIIGCAYIYINFYERKELEATGEELAKKIIMYAVPLTLTTTGNAIDRRMDSILIGFYLGPVSVAYYALSKQIVSFIRTPVDALGFTLAPTYKSQQQKGKPELAARIYKKALFHGLLIYIPATAGLTIIAEPLIRLVFGSQYIGAVPVLQIMTIYALMLSISTLTSDALDYLGYARSLSLIRGVSALINVVLNIILIPRIGVEGAAIAIVVGYSGYTITIVYLMLYEMEIQLTWLVYSITPIAFITSVMSTVVFILSKYAENLIILFLVVATGVLVWLFLALAFNLLSLRELISLFD